MFNFFKKIKEAQAKKQAEAEARHKKNIAFMESEIEESKTDMLSKECVVQRRQCFETCSFFRQGGIIRKYSKGETCFRSWLAVVPCTCGLIKE